MTYYVFKTKSSIANCADGNSRLFNLLVPLSCGCPSQVPHHVPLRVCQFINPSCRRRMPFSSPPGWLVLTVRASQWLLKDNQGFLFFPHLSSAHHSPLPAKFKYMTQHCDISDELCISLCVSLSSFVSFALVSFTPSAFPICFLHSPAAQPFKGQWF